MKNRKALLAILAATSVLVAMASNGLADTLGYSSTEMANAIGAAGGPTNSGGGIGLTGIEFTVNQTIDVTQLGFYADSLGGAGDTPEINLYDVTTGLTTPVLLYSTGEQPRSDFTNGAYTYFTTTTAGVATPIALTVGNTYLVDAAAYFSPIYDASTVSLGSSIATSAFVQGSGFGGFDTTSYSTATLAPTSNDFGVVDFQYTVVGSGVPEPSTYAMLAAGMVLLVALQRRRSQQA